MYLPGISPYIDFVNLHFHDMAIVAVHFMKPVTSKLTSFILVMETKK